MQASNPIGVTMIDDALEVSSNRLDDVSGPSSDTRDGLGGVIGDSGATARALLWARTGDRQALGFLYARYADDVFACVRPIVGDDRGAEALTREIFASITDLIDRHRHCQMPFRTWIAHTSRAMALDRLGERSLPEPEAPTPRTTAA